MEYIQIKTPSIFENAVRFQEKGSEHFGVEEVEENRQSTIAFLDFLNEQTEKMMQGVYVFDSIKNDLEQICSDVKVTKKKEILKLSYVQHIYSQFEGNLKSDIDDFKIISAIHPTPSVSGYPKQNIRPIIKRYEAFFRGFYAGPVGWVGKDSSEFAVGIRSGIINDGFLSIYSGAGIVKKSSPELEWSEIENKISPFLKILQNK